MNRQKHDKRRHARYDVLLALAGLILLSLQASATEAPDHKRNTGPVRRELAITRNYLLLPVKNGAPVRRMRFEVDGATTEEFDIELVEDNPDFWVFADVSRHRGKKLILETRLPDGSMALERIRTSDEISDAATLYREKYRPQLHFTSRRGWLNDPNGLVYAGGTWHLFYQHNPYGWNWGNMHWGHAVSKDLFRWQELPIALHPRKYGDWCFSGSAVVDQDNTSGWHIGTAPLLVCAFTSTGRGECIAYSNDLGRTWTEYAGNPVVKHNGRDPKLIWHAPSKRWVMAVYDENGPSRDVVFYTSPDLKKWEFQSRIGGFYECPDLFALPVESDPKTRYWVLYAADGKYVLGQFDGQRFIRESGKHQLWYGNFYAAQTFDSAPDGRRIQIGWANGITFPGMPFNQQMTVPCELTLRRTSEGVRLFAMPVKELDTLHAGERAWKNLLLHPGENPLASVQTELSDVQAEFQPKGADRVVFALRGVSVVYDVPKGEVSCQGKTAPLQPHGGQVALRMLIDCGSIEIFGNDGQVVLSAGVLVPPSEQSFGLSAKGGDVAVKALKVSSLKSAWK
jgi:fructan beta-fructosidase